LWKRLGRVVYGNRKKQCTLKDMQGTVAALKEVVRKAEGLTDYIAANRIWRQLKWVLVTAFPLF